MSCIGPIWTEAEEVLLRSSAPVRKLAQQLKCSVETVRRHRRARGVGPALPRWTAAEEDAVRANALPIKALAAQLGRSQHSIWTKRSLLGVTAAPPRSPRAVSPKPAPQPRAPKPRPPKQRASQAGRNTAPMQAQRPAIVEKRCLSCREQFRTAPHLYVCAACKKTLEWKVAGIA